MTRFLSCRFPSWEELHSRIHPHIHLKQMTRSWTSIQDDIRQLFLEGYKCCGQREARETSNDKFWLHNFSVIIKSSILRLQGWRSVGWGEGMVWEGATLKTQREVNKGWRFIPCCPLKPILCFYSLTTLLIWDKAKGSRLGFKDGISYKAYQQWNEECGLLLWKKRVWGKRSQLE